MSAYWKIPLQVLVLLLGVMVFVFYVFNTPPLLFSSAQEKKLKEGPAANQYATLETEFTTALTARRSAGEAFADARDSGDASRIAAARADFVERNNSVSAVRTRALSLVRDTTGDRNFTDVNYIIPTFILTHLPIGLIGLLIVAIVMAATDTIAGELNSLSTATVIDFYRRWITPVGSDAHYLAVSKAATGVWGLVACGVAVWAAELGSLIEVVNRFGSFFYGSILGVFILAVGFPRATGTGAFVGLLAGMGSVAWVASMTKIAFLWHNVVGAVGVVVVGLAVSLLERAIRGPQR